MFESKPAAAEMILLVSGRIRVLVVGPVPPALGGIATYVSNQVDEFSSQELADPILVRVWGAEPVTPASALRKAITVSKNVLRILLQETDPSFDIAHIHTSHGFSLIESCIYTLVIRLVSNAPIIVHIHSGSFVERLEATNRIVRWYLRHFLSQVDLVITVSEELMARLSTSLNHEIRVMALPNAVRTPDSSDPSRIVADCISVLGRRKLVLGAGRLTEGKGFQDLVGAMAVVASRHADVFCIIAGAGPYGRELQDMIRRLNLDDWVMLIGAIPNRELLRLISVSQVVVLPSHLSEGAPMVMYETLSMGRPFIGTNVGTIPDVIVSDEYGYVVEPGSVEHLASRILESLERKWNHSAISDYGSRFSWAKLSRELLKVYYSTLRNRHTD